MKWTIRDIVIPDTSTVKVEKPASKKVKRVTSKQPKKQSKVAVEEQPNANVEDTLALKDLSKLKSWKKVKYPGDISFTDGAAGGFTELEELDGVEVIYEDTPNLGRVIKFKARTAPEPAQIEVEENISDNSSEDEEAEDAMEAFDRAIFQRAEPVQKPRKVVPQSAVEENVIPDALSASVISAMKNWGGFHLNSMLLKNLHGKGFLNPTPIQERVLAACSSGGKLKDIIGTAETGSGKTLAFGLPIINGILNDNSSGQGTQALILTPTRELAVQICDHFQAMVVDTPIKVMAIVGGMSVEKQERQLSWNPDIIIATPGRFWELLSEKQNSQFDNLRATVKYLVLDEADRMVESGHFRELDGILSTLNTQKIHNEWSDKDFDMVEVKKKHKVEDKPTRQTFIFSATLNGMPNDYSKKPSTTSVMDDLIKRVEFTNAEKAIIDLTSEQLVARTLTETKIECLKVEKDLYMYFFLARYPGRTIVFVNSIDCIRRLVPIFTNLKVQVYGLHAQMQQRQRLKNLDRFKEGKHSVLIASDVAARGLDIPSVDHVIHYQLPRSTELYVHRSGRTARANKNGITVMLYSPEERNNYAMICRVLKKEKGLPDFPVELGFISPLKQRVALAIQMDKMTHTNKKKGSDDKWLRDMAGKMDLEMSEDEVDDDGKARLQKSNDSIKLHNLRSELNQLLKKPLMPRGASSKYLTSGSVANLPSLLISNLKTSEGSLQHFPAAEQVNAVDAATRKRPRVDKTK